MATQARLSRQARNLVGTPQREGWPVDLIDLLLGRSDRYERVPGLLGRLAFITHIPRPAYTAIASAIAASLVFFMMTSSPEYSKEAGDYISEQTSYLFSDNGVQQSESETEADDEFDSVIEVFFM